MPDTPAFLDPEIISSFWSNVRRAGPRDCWLWFAGAGSHQYGQFYFPGPAGAEMVLAHRFAWQVANAREVPGRLHVLHTCDIRCCVNPAHLYAGTRSQNMLDARDRGRTPTRLNPDIVRRLRRLHFVGEMPVARIAAELELPYSTVANAVSGNCWQRLRGAA